MLQFAVQLPTVLKLERELKLGWGTQVEGVREAVRNAGPAVVGRGVVQISGYLDYFLASFLAAGALATLSFAQLFYMLPISLFAMSVAAAELPEMSRRAGRGGGGAAGARVGGAGARGVLYRPVVRGVRALGDVVVATLLQTGKFSRADTLIVYFTLVAFALGLLATTASRMLSTTFFALRDTKTPARYAIVRVVLSARAGRDADDPVRGDQGGPAGIEHPRRHLLAPADRGTAAGRGGAGAGDGAGRVGGVGAAQARPARPDRPAWARARGR